MSLTIIENYDYPALIALFGMCKTIQYTYPKVDKYLQSMLACVAKPSAIAPGSPCQHTRRTPGGTSPAAP